MKRTIVTIFFASAITYSLTLVFGHIGVHRPKFPTSYSPELQDLFKTQRIVSDGKEIQLLLTPEEEAQQAAGTLRIVLRVPKR